MPGEAARYRPAGGRANGTGGPLRGPPASTPNDQTGSDAARLERDLDRGEVVPVDVDVEPFEVADGFGHDVVRERPVVRRRREDGRALEVRRLLGDLDGAIPVRLVDE